MKEWRVYYKRKHSEGFDTRAEAIAFIGKTVNAGGSICDIKQKGRSVLATTVFILLRDARVRLTMMPNKSPEPTAVAAGSSASRFTP